MPQIVFYFQTIFFSDRIKTITNARNVCRSTESLINPVLSGVAIPDSNSQIACENIALINPVLYLIVIV